MLTVRPLLLATMAETVAQVTHPASQEALFPEAVVVVAVLQRLALVAPVAVALEVLEVVPELLEL
jgi:hypothetical protein